MNKTLLNFSFVLILGMLFATVYILMQKPWQALGNVSVGEQLQSTTTPQLADRTNLCPKLGANPNNVGSSTTGMLGSVHLLSLSVGDILILDATTTVASQRAVAATSSLILAWYPVGSGTSTVAFNAEFKNGILVDYGTSVGTSTITYRCEG